MFTTTNMLKVGHCLINLQFERPNKEISAASPPDLSEPPQRSVVAADVTEPARRNIHSSLWKPSHVLQNVAVLATFLAAC